jgi:hypothetical protein
VSETVQTARAQSNQNTFTNKHQMGRDFFSIWNIPLRKKKSRKFRQGLERIYWTGIREKEFHN